MAPINENLKVVAMRVDEEEYAFLRRQENPHDFIRNLIRRAMQMQAIIEELSAPGSKVIHFPEISGK